jgi:hypothetical protein
MATFRSRNYRWHLLKGNLQDHSPTSILKGNPMKPSKLYEALHALIGERVPLHIWGACGVGKSQIVAQVANDLDYDFLDVRAVQLDPVDLRGLPRIAADQTEWVPPKFLPTTGKGILFLDELTSAPQMTQAGCYQLVLDRRLGEYVLPDGWVVIAAGNPASERGVHFAMPRPLRNRFVHLDLEPDLDDWCRWAVKAQVRPEIIAFLRFKPELLHTSDATSDANAWRPCSARCRPARLFALWPSTAIRSWSTLAAHRSVIPWPRSPPWMQLRRSVRPTLDKHSPSLKRTQLQL